MSELTEEQRLNSIRAYAIEKAIIETESEHEHGFCCSSHDLLDYANQVRGAGMGSEYTISEEIMDSTIPKKPVDVIFALSTESNIQTGVVYLEPGERLSDLMNNNNTFLPIKYGDSGSYFLVNKEFIVTIKEKQYG